MDLTAVQQRTLDDLIGSGTSPVFPRGLYMTVRLRLEDELRAAGFADESAPAIWLGKGRLNDRERCDGLFAAGLFGETPPFVHSAATAAGTVSHKAVEVDAITEGSLDPRSVCEAAVKLCLSDVAFRRLWNRLDAVARAGVLADAGRRLSLFRDSFPPLVRRWFPQSELRLKVRLVAGRVSLVGGPDLVLGRTHRLAIDFKVGGARPEQAEDMRFYALLILLRCGIPPYRVATFFLDSGQWQAEDVDESVLHRAIDRIVETAHVGLSLLRGRAPALRPGAHCAWCARAPACPVAAHRAAGEVVVREPTAALHGGDLRA